MVLSFRLLPKPDGQPRSSDMAEKAMRMRGTGQGKRICAVQILVPSVFCASILAKRLTLLTDNEPCNIPHGGLVTWLGAYRNPCPRQRGSQQKRREIGGSLYPENIHGCSYLKYSR